MVVLALLMANMMVVRSCGAQESPSSGMVYAQQTALKAKARAGLPGILPPHAAIPAIGPDASKEDYLNAAEEFLSIGKYAQAELSLEWADYRDRLDEVDKAFDSRSITPLNDADCSRPICAAMNSVGRLNAGKAMTSIELALSNLHNNDPEYHSTAHWSRRLGDATRMYSTVFLVDLGSVVIMGVVFITVLYGRSIMGLFRREPDY